MSAPPGYSTVSPYLIVESAQQTITFLQSAFDAEPLRRYEDDAGGIIHAEVRIGNAVVMVADSAPDWPPVPGHVHVYVDDADASYERALRAGAELLQKPQAREGDPDRRGGVRGPGGITWWIATPIDSNG